MKKTEVIQIKTVGSRFMVVEMTKKGKLKRVVGRMKGTRALPKI